MNMLTKLALNAIGQLRARPASGDAAGMVELPPPDTHGGMPLMQALALRHSTREFRPDPLSPQELSNLLWAADGINRPREHEHTAPSAMNAQEIDLYAALPDGLYRYDAERHALVLTERADVRRVTGMQDFVDDAALDLVFVADHARMKLVPAQSRAQFAAASAGAMAQNVYLFCASAGLAAVVRAWFDATALATAMHLAEKQHVVLAQTVGRPAHS
jgi:SagB-type dehydrogenase family enzyme